MTRRSRQFLLLSAMLIALPVSAEVYRWTDESGETNFGSNPPAGVDAKPVSTQTDNNIENASRQDEKDSSNEEEEEQASSGENAEKQQDQGDAEREEVREENCEAARQALNTLKENARVQVKDDDGERRYLSEKEKKEEKERYQEIRDENCD